MHYFSTGFGGLSPMFPAAGVLLVLLLAWSIVWKGLALWRAAKRGEKIWFIVFMLVNTAGILELIYLFVITGAKLSDFRLSSDKGKDA